MDQYGVSDVGSAFLDAPLMANVASARFAGEVNKGQKRKPAPGSKPRGGAGGGNAPNRRKLRKNNREKQRRSELNNKFDMLTELLNIDAKAKVEKVVVLTEAINLIQGLRAENNELKIEKSEMRTELVKLTSCLQQAFPGQPIPLDPRFRFLAESKNGFDISGMGSLGMPPAMPQPESNTYEASMAVTSSVQQSANQQSGGIALASNQQGHQVGAAHAGSKGPFVMSTTAGATSLDEDFDVFC